MKATLELSDVDSLKEGDTLVGSVRGNMTVLETDVVGEMIVESNIDGDHVREHTAGVKVRDGSNVRNVSYKHLTDIDPKVRRKAGKLTDEQKEMVRARHN